MNMDGVLPEPNITFRMSCKDCKFNGKCFLDPRSRMIKRRCYIDAIAKKLKIKPQTVVARCHAVLKKYVLDNFYFIENIDKEYWLELNNRQRQKYISFILDYYANRENSSVKNEDIKLSYAVANCYFSAWRDEEYIPCACCGKIIKNSKQRNRKYCDRCNKKKTIYDEKIKECIDCGCEFEAWHNREVRCIDCQIKANKASARERAKRYRDKKRNGLETKS